MIALRLAKRHLRFPIRLCSIGVGFASDVYLLWPWLWKQTGWRPWYDINFNDTFRSLAELDQEWADYTKSEGANMTPKTKPDNPFDELLFTIDDGLESGHYVDDLDHGLSIQKAADTISKIANVYHIIPEWIRAVDIRLDEGALDEDLKMSRTVREMRDFIASLIDADEYEHPSDR